MKLFLSVSKAPAAMAVAVGILVAAAAFAQAPDLEKMDLVLRSVPDGPVARVNGVAIGNTEFISLYRSEIANAMMRLHTSMLPDSARLETGIKCVVMLIQREILFQEAKEKKLTVSAAELEKRWAEEMEMLKKSARHPEGKEIGEEEILKAMGATRESARAEFQKAMLVEKMSGQIAKEKGIAVSDKEVAEFFNKNKEAFKKPERLHLQQIFVKAPRGKDAQDDKKRADARVRIEKGLKRIQAGESFDAVAKSVSEAPDKDKGGDLGIMPVSALPPFFVEPAASMRPGDISDVIESDLGYHVFKVIEVIAGADPRLEDAAPRIRKMLEGVKTEAIMDEFCRPFVKQPGYAEVYLQLDKTLATYPGAENLKTKPKAKDAPAKSKAAPAPAKKKAGAK